MKTLKTFFLLTAITLCCFATDVGAQVPQKFPASLFMKEVSATNNSTNLNNAYFKLKPSTQRVGIGTINPLYKLDVRGTVKVQNTDSFSLGCYATYLNGVPASGAMWKNGTAQGFSGVIADGYAFNAYISKGGKYSTQQTDSGGVGSVYFNRGTNPLYGFTEAKVLSNGYRIWGFDSTGQNTLLYVKRYSELQHLFTILQNGNIGIHDSVPDYPLDVAGTAAATHFVCTQNASIMSATTDTGAGTGASITVTGNDHAGSIQLTTGTSCASSATCATITYHTAFPSGFSSVVITAKNSATAAISGNKSVYVTPSDIDFDINAGTTALSDGATYAWNYVVLR